MPPFLLISLLPEDQPTVESSSGHAAIGAKGLMGLINQSVRVSVSNYCSRLRDYSRRQSSTYRTGPEDQLSLSSARTFAAASTVVQPEFPNETGTPLERESERAIAHRSPTVVGEGLAVPSIGDEDLAFLFYLLPAISVGA